MKNHINFTKFLMCTCVMVAFMIMGASNAFAQCSTTICGGGATFSQGTSPATPAIPSSNTSCLGTSCNAATFFVYENVTSGTVSLTLTNTNANDLDYVAYGPYASEADADAASCALETAGDLNTTAAGAGEVDCSFAGGSTETISHAANAGEFFTLVVCNFSNTPTDVALQDANAGAAGSIAPCPPCFSADIPDPVVCSGDNLEINIDATTAPGGASAAVVLVCGGVINGDASPVPVGTAGIMTLNNFEQIIGDATCELVIVDDPNACPACTIDPGCVPVPVEFTFLEGIETSQSTACNADGTGQVTVTVGGGGLPAYDGGATMYTIAGADGDGSMVAAGGTYSFAVASGTYEVIVVDDNGCESLVAGQWLPPAMTIEACQPVVCVSEYDNTCNLNPTAPLIDCITGTIEPQVGGFSIFYVGNGDGFPQEQSFTIFNSAGAPVGSGAPSAFPAQVDVTGLDPGDTYTILFEDSFGDGLDCTGVGTFAVTDFDGTAILPATPFDCGGTVVTCSSAGGCTSMGPFPLGSPNASIAPVGTFTGPGVIDGGDNTADFDPAAAGVGVHTISFDFTDSRGCVLNETVEIEVVDCDCKYEFCESLTSTAGLIAPVTGNNTTPGFVTTYVLVEAGIVTQISDVLDFDMTIAGGDGCQIYSVNYDAADPVAQGLVVEGQSLATLQDPGDPCICIDVSSNFCTIFKIPAPEAPVTTSICVCEGDDATITSTAGACSESACQTNGTTPASTSQVAWFANQDDLLADAIVVLASGAPFDPQDPIYGLPTDPGTYVYWSSTLCSGVDGPDCESERTGATYDIIPTPDAPDLDNPAPICGEEYAAGGPPSVLLTNTQAGSTFNVYEADNATLIQSGVSGTWTPALVATGAAGLLDADADGTPDAGTYTFYISELISSTDPGGGPDCVCESLTAPVQITIFEPANASINSDCVNICTTDDPINIESSIDVAAGADLGGFFIESDANANIIGGPLPGNTFDPMGTAALQGAGPIYYFVYQVTNSDGCTATSDEAVPVHVCQGVFANFDSPGDLCEGEDINLEQFLQTNVDNTGIDAASGTWELIDANGVSTPIADPTNFVAPNPGPACGFFTIQNTVTSTCDETATEAGCSIDCTNIATQTVQICPSLDPTFMTTCVCCDAMPYWLPGGGNLTNPDPGTYQELPSIAVADITGTWTGSGVFFNDGGTPNDPSDDLYYFDPRVDDPVGTLAQIDPAAQGQFITSEGEWTVQYEIGEQPCENEYVLDFDISCPVDVSLTDNSICVSPSNSLNLIGQFTEATTPGGIWFLDPNTDPNPDPANGDIAVSPGGALTYDATTITEATTVVVSYSVGNACAGGACVGIGSTTITLVPAPQVDFDYPDFACNSELMDLNMWDYVVTPSGSVPSSTDAFYINNYTPVGGNPTPCNGDPACPYTVSNDGATATIQGAGDFLGLMEVCYEELASDGAGQDCVATDCELIYITEINATVQDAEACVDCAGECFDLDQLFTAETTQGGVFIINSATDQAATNVLGDFTINGGNLCYDSNSVDDITTVTVTYSVAADPSGVGTTCIRIDEADIVLVPSPDPYFAGEQTVCATDPGFTIDLFDDCYGDNAWYADAANWQVTGNSVGNNGMDGLVNGLFTVNAANGNALDVDPEAAIANPTMAGEYLITYTASSTGLTTGPGGTDCTDVISTSVFIYPSYDACFDLQASICTSNAPFVLTADEDMLTDFTNNSLFGQMESEISIWNVVGPDGVTTTLPLVGDGSGDATFDPGVGPGTYTITHFLGYDNCQTTCVAQIEVKPIVDADIEDQTICSSTSQNIDLGIMFTGTTTGGGTFTLDPDGDGYVGTATDPNGNTVNLTTADVAILANGVTLVYQSNLAQDATDMVIDVLYTVGDPLCCDDATTAAVEMCMEGMDDCYDEDQATLYITGGHDVFLDFPEDEYCSDADPICIYDFSSIEDVSLPGVEVDLDGVLEPGEVSFEVVAVNGSYDPDSLYVDANNNGVPDVGIDFFYADVIDLSGCVGTDDASGPSTAGYTCDCATVNLEGVPKEVTLTIRMTYFDFEDANGNGIADPSEIGANSGCIALAEDNIFVIPAGNAPLKDGEICVADGVIDLTTLFYYPIDNAPEGVTTVCGDFYIQCPEDADLGTTMDPNDENMNGTFDPNDANYPNYDFTWLDDPTKLYITYVVGQEPCTIDTGMTVIDLCPQPTAFTDVVWGECIEGGTINLLGLAGLPANAPGTWTLNGAPVANPAELTCADLDAATTATGPSGDEIQVDGVFVYTAGSDGCCPDASATVTIDANYSCATDDCVEFSDANNGDPLDPAYCTSDPDFAANSMPTLRSVCPEIIEVGPLSDAICNVSNDIGFGAAVRGDVLQISIPQNTVYPNATVDDDWYIQLIYVNTNPGIYGAGDVCADGPQGGVGTIDEDFDMLGGDHWGHSFYGTSNPSSAFTPPSGWPAFNPATYGMTGDEYNLMYVMNDECPQNPRQGGRTAVIGDIAADVPGCPYTFDPDLYMYNNTDPAVIAGYDPLAGVPLPAPTSEYCSDGADIGTNDYFILQLDAADIYAMYGGKQAFLDDFFGNNCNAPSVFSWAFAANTLDDVTDIMMVMHNMTIYNYKEDVSAESTLYCPNDGPEDFGFTLRWTDISCDDGSTVVTGLPDWLTDFSSVFTVAPSADQTPVQITDLAGNAVTAITPAAGYDPICWDVTLDLNQLVPPACDDRTYEFEICHTINKCEGDCDGDGEYQACQTLKISRDHVPNSDVSYTEDGEDGLLKLGCIDDDKQYFTAEELACFFEPYTIPVDAFGTYPADANSGAATCEVPEGDWVVPAPFCDYVIQNGDDYAVLQTICEGLEADFGALTGNDFGYTAPTSTGNDLVGLPNPNEPYPSMLNNPKRLIIPVEYTTQVCETCPPNTIVRYVQVTKAPEVTLAIPDSPGICPEEQSIICLDEYCEWPNCTYDLVFTNANSINLISSDTNPVDGIPDLQNPGCPTDLGTAPVEVEGVDIVYPMDADYDPALACAPNAPYIIVDWQVLSEPGVGVLDAAGEELLGNFNLELTVHCGSADSFCSDSDDQDLFFLGEVHPDIADLETCESPINLTGMYVPADGGTNFGTTPGGFFYVDGTAVAGNEVTLDPGTYEVVYIVGPTTACEASDTATLTVLESYQVTLDVPEICNFNSVDLTQYISVIDAASGAAVTLDADDLNDSVMDAPGANNVEGGFSVVSGGGTVDANGVFTPDAGFYGVVTVQYQLDTYDSAGNPICTIFHEELITIFPEYSALFDAPTEICEDQTVDLTIMDANLTADIAAGLLNNYGLTVEDVSQWSVINQFGIATVLTTNADGGATFDPMMHGGDGLYAITHTVGFGSCTSTTFATIEVYPAVDATIADFAFNCNAPASGNISLTALFTGSTTTGGTFSGDGVAGGSVFVYSAPGCYEITYTVSSFANADQAGACYDSQTAFILVPEQPDPIFFVQDQVCYSANDPNQTYTPVYTPSSPNATATWTVVGGSATVIDPATGTIQITGTDDVVLSVTESIAYDACGSIAAGECTASYTQNIVIEDGTSVSANFTVSNMAPCLGEAVTLTPDTPGGYFTGAGVVDPGNGGPGTFQMGMAGEYTVTYVVNSSSGCTNAYSLIITVDEVAPVITCPGDVTVTTDAAQCTASLSLPLTASDNCTSAANLTITNDWNNTADASGSYPIGTTPVTYTVTDEAGNSSSCTFYVTVTDDEAPLVNCPDDIDIFSCDEVPAPAAIAATDNCTAAGDLVITVNDITTQIGATTTIIRNYTVEDEYGNATQCQQIITVVDFLQAPNLSQVDPFCYGDDLGAGITAGGGTYNFYDAAGNLIAACAGAGSCSPADLGLSSTTPGTFVISVTELVTTPDGNVCESMASTVTYTIYEELTADVSGYDICSPIDGTIPVSVVPSGGDGGPYSVSVDGGLTYTPLYGTVVNLGPGSYDVYVNDAGLCGPASVAAFTIEPCCEDPVLFTSDLSDNVVCSGAEVTFTATIANPADAEPFTEITITGDDGQTATMTGDGSGMFSAALTVTNDECAPATYTYTIEVFGTCTNITTAIFSEDITVYPSNIDQFVTVTIADNECMATASIDPSCLTGDMAPYVYFVDDNGDNVGTSVSAGSYPGEYGDWTFNYEYFSASASCLAASGSQTVPYNCEESFMIDDPCACGNPDNYFANGILYMEETITITGPAGDTWTLDAGNLTDGAIYDNAGNTVTSVLTFTELVPGMYELIFWHEEVVGFAGFVSNGGYTAPVANACGPCYYPPACASDAGTLTYGSGPSVCTTDLLDATTLVAPEVPAGFNTLYVLTSGTGLVIEAVNNSPSFGPLAEGDYTIHTLVYDPATLDLSIVVPGVTTGFDVNGLLLQGGGAICGSLDVTGLPYTVIDCTPPPTCGNAAGTLPSAVTFLCAGDFQNFSSAGANVDNGSVLTYVLHSCDNNTIGTIYDISNTGTFTNNGTLPTNVELSVSAVVGTPGANGLPDLSDDCTFISNCAPVVLLDPVVISSQEMCNGVTGDFMVEFTITGGGPAYTSTHAYDVSGDYVNPATQAGQTYTFGPISDGSTYTITVNDDDKGCSTSYTSAPVQCEKLPIELISYTGEAIAEGNLLKWVTATEINNDYFTLERSIDGINFEFLNEQAGAGTTSTPQAYEFLDKEAPMGVSYYKLWQTDFDGTTVEVGIVTLYRGDSAIEITELMPNPAVNDISVIYSMDNDSEISILVHNALGQLMADRTELATAGMNSVDLDITSFAAGVYTVTIVRGDDIVTKKFVKE